MATKAYFVINVAEEFCRDYYQDMVRELKAIPEVKSIERISGTSDLLVKVEAPMRAIFVADKILVKQWVKRLVILKVQPFRPDEYQGLTVEELLKLRRVLQQATDNYGARCLP